jgi:hypothetical protein
MRFDAKNQKSLLSKAGRITLLTKVHNPAMLRAMSVEVTWTSTPKGPLRTLWLNAIKATEGFSLNQWSGFQDQFG